MRIRVLSDRPAELLAEAVRERKAEQARLDERYLRDLDARGQSIAEASGERGQAWARVRLLAWLRWSLALRRRRRRPVPQRTILPLSPAEASRAAGVRGERQVSEALQVLGDSWVLFQGYRNPRGEIDFLLLGPDALLAVEVKHVNGTFRITRDRWTYVRNDRSARPRVGAPTEVEADARGRPPGVQLAEPLAELERFLASRGQQSRFCPVVLLNHPRARIGYQAADTGVRILTSEQQLLELARNAGARIGAARLTAIERLIARDHQHHEQRRSSGTG